MQHEVTCPCCDSRIVVSFTAQAETLQVANLQQLR